MNRGRFAFLGSVMTSTENPSERAAAEAIVCHLLPPRPRDLNDPATWSVQLLSAVQRERDRRMASLRQEPGIASVEADPRDPRGILIVSAEPVRFIKIDTSRTPWMVFEYRMAP